MRMTIPPNDRVLDLYTKTGDLPGCSTILALIPDWDLRFTIFSAGDEPHSIVAALTNLIGELFLPAVEIAAREEAVRDFARSHISSDEALNSSITNSTDDSKPGLGVTSWISNGTDILSLPANVTFAGPNVQLYPTSLKKVNADRETMLGFRAVYEELSLPTYEGLYPTWWSWAIVDSTYWGSLTSDEWLFAVDASGLAVSATPRITRVELVRI
ncbi:hypothetical protein B7494_g5150 [Chlorociboria aeruginascens]|nr:hypothetical protein B7494_g5150 [Chlorociboria aeruginascens]